MHTRPRMRNRYRKNRSVASASKSSCETRKAARLHASRVTNRDAANKIRPIKKPSLLWNAANARMSVSSAAKSANP